MRALLRADLLALGNLLSRREGRTAVGGNAITFVCVVFGSLFATNRFLLPRRVLEILREDTSGEVARFLLGLVAVPVALLVVSIGLSEGKRRLFDDPAGDLLLGSPLPRAAIVLHAFLRLLAPSVLFGAALGIPATALVLDGAHAGPAAAFLAFPIAGAALAAPVLAGVLLFQVVAMRWFAGRRVRLLLQGLVALSGIAFALVAALGLLGEKGDLVARWVGEGAALPATFEGPAAIVALLAGVPGDASRVLPALVLLAATVPALALAVPAYPRARENAHVSAEPLRRRRAGRARRWPTSVAASIAWKDIRLLAQQPGSWLGYLFVPALLVLLAKGDLFSRVWARAEVPDLLRDLFRAFNVWYVVLFLVGIFTLVGWIGEDQVQRPLLAASPASRASLLRGKLFLVVHPLAWCSLAAIAVLRFVSGTPALALGLLLVLTVPFVAIAVGGIAAIATIPPFARIEKDVPVTHSLRVVMPILALSAALAPLWILALEGLETIRVYYQGRGPLEDLPEWAAWLLPIGTAWVGGLLVGWIGWRIALSNYRRLLDPEP